MTHDISGKKYELMLILPPNLTEKELQKELDNVRSLVTKLGQIFHEQVWGRRDLYYTLKGHDKAVYALIDFVSDKNLDSFTRELQLTPHILRFLLQTLPDSYEVKPFVTIEEPEKKVEKKEEKKPRVKKETVKEEVQKEIKKVSEPVIEEKKETKKAVEEPAESKDTEQTSDKKKKKSSFDDKIDEIINNLDKL